MNTKTIISLLAIAPALVWRAQAKHSDTNSYPLLCCSNRTYTNATLKGVTPAYVSIECNEETERIPFTNLPPEIQARYDTLGQPQRVRIVGMMGNNQFQIEAGGRVVQAVIPNLPPVITSFILDYIQSKGKINVAIGQLKQDLASAGPGECNRYLYRARNGTSSHCKFVVSAAQWAAANSTHPGYVGGGNAGGNVGGASRLAAGNANAGISAAAADAAVRASKEVTFLDELGSHFLELQAKLDSGYTTVMACPTGFFVSASTKQWKFQAMAADQPTGITNQAHVQPPQTQPAEAPTQAPHLITLYTGTNSTTFTSAGSVTNIPGGCSFENAATHRPMTVTGTVTIEELGSPVAPSER